MTNPPSEPPPEHPSWSWELSTSGSRPPEEQQAEAGLTESPDLGGPLSTPKPATSPAVPPPPPPDRYPMVYDVEYPESLSRWKTLLRVVLALPLMLFLWPLAAGLVWPPQFPYLLLLVVAAASFPAWVAIFLKRKYPLWMFAWLSGFLGFAARAQAYMLLLTDRFPSFDPEESPVTLEYDEPPSGYLSRWRVFLWKAALLIPHMIVLGFLMLAVFVVVLLSWFAILFTGRYPRGMFAFVTGANRWTYRLAGYFASFNDRYPPYALAADAGPASNATTVASGVGGWLVVGGYAVLIGAVASLGSGVKTERVDYERLVQGRPGPSIAFEPALADGPVILSLERAYDPGDDLVLILAPARNERVIVFEWEVWNRSGSGATVEAGAVRLKYESAGDDRWAYAEILAVGNRAAPVRLPDRSKTPVQAVFVVPAGATPLELRFAGGFASGGVRYVFD